MHPITSDLFPGLQELLPVERFRRVDNAIQSLFTKTFHKMEDGLPFIITGDIPAMWLRDSTWQVKPLLKSNHEYVADFLANLSRAQIKLFLIDPYANAFNPAPNNNRWHTDFAEQSPWVFERKYELDSWASILYLARKVREQFGREDHLDENFSAAVHELIKLARREQNHDRESYVFKRNNTFEHDYLSHDGRGAPLGYTGMVFSAFRPSDDACTYGYHIPSNLFFQNELRLLAEYFPMHGAEKLAQEIAEGVRNFGVIEGIYAYEVDGLGNRLLIDDANIPSLLSLPYLGVLDASDEIYQNTREFVFSSRNPYFYVGEHASGIGSPHTPELHVWPIALAVEGITSQNLEQQLKILEKLESTDASTGMMHESFHVDNPRLFTRDWFSWADMMYVDLVLHSVKYISQHRS